MRRQRGFDIISRCESEELLGIRATPAAGRTPAFGALSRLSPASIPLLVGFCVALIFGAFTLAALILMRLDRDAAQSQAAAGAAGQAQALAAIAAANLD